MTEGKRKRLILSVVWREAKELVWANRTPLLLGLVVMIINRLMSLVLPASTKYFIDEVIFKHQTNLLTIIVLMVGIATVVQSITSFLLSQIIGVAAQRVITEMRRRLNTKVLHLPIRYFDSTQSGKLISRIMTDAEGIRNLVGTGLIQFVSSLLTATIALTVLFYLNWLLTTVMLLILIVFSGALFIAFKRLRPLFHKRGEINAEVTGRLSESLVGIRVVKSYIAEKREELVFTRGVHKLFRNIAKTLTGVSAITSFTSLIIGAIGIAIMFVGGHAILSGSMTLGELVMYISFTSLIAMPVIDLASIGSQMAEAFAGLDRIREIMSMETEDEEDSKRIPLNKVYGNIEVEKVSFEYNPGELVLKEVSFSAPAGTTTALVGPSGSGKSTLINLIMNFDKPLSGKIKLDGQDLSNIRLRDYRSHLGIVLQDNFLFDGPIIENIRFSNPHATLEEIREASRIAHADEFIERFEDGYNTIVGERGIKLSGGQRQRIAIARAILANPQILILDEATSSLDSESEALIQDGLRSLRQGRTTFVIAHRLSTIRSADQILVFEHGEIIERGTHYELLAKKGRYKQLYDKQYRFKNDQFINPGEDSIEETSFTLIEKRGTKTSHSSL
jgi:ABC-type multidrug transport system fused ATPase/permease subunit